MAWHESVEASCTPVLLFELGESRGGKLLGRRTRMHGGDA